MSIFTNQLSVKLLLLLLLLLLRLRLLAMISYTMIVMGLRGCGGDGSHNNPCIYVYIYEFDGLHTIILQYRSSDM